MKKRLRVLELGNYIVPAYAGMILAEQGHQVEKWTNGGDPILGLTRGDELWAWINHGKTLNEKHPAAIAAEATRFEIVLDNFRPETLEKWGINPTEIAERAGIAWVSLRADLGDVSFDLLAQCRSWLEYGPYIPFYVGDTVGGLWLAFKALAVTEPGHYVVHHATCLQKLVEGELVIDIERNGREVPWDAADYRFVDGHAEIRYKGRLFREPVRDRAWKLDNLRHSAGRMLI